MKVGDRVKLLGYQAFGVIEVDKTIDYHRGFSGDNKMNYLIKWRNGGDHDWRYASELLQLPAPKGGWAT